MTQLYFFSKIFRSDQLNKKIFSFIDSDVCLVKRLLSVNFLLLQNNIRCPVMEHVCFCRFFGLSSLVESCLFFDVTVLRDTSCCPVPTYCRYIPIYRTLLPFALCCTNSFVNRNTIFEAVLWLKKNIFMSP